MGEKFLRKDRYEQTAAVVGERRWFASESRCVFEKRQI
jgi:hypothetical protein